MSYQVSFTFTNYGKSHSKNMGLKKQRREEMKQVGKKMLAFLLAITMIAGMTLNDVTIARAEEKAPCITLSDGVKEEVNETTYIYNGYKPYLGDKFTDSEKHGMLLCKQKCLR